MKVLKISKIDYNTFEKLQYIYNLTIKQLKSCTNQSFDMVANLREEHP